MTTMHLTSNRLSPRMNMHSEAALPIGRAKTIACPDNGDGIAQNVIYEGISQYGPTVVKTAVVAHQVAIAVAHSVAVVHLVAIRSI